MIYKSYLVEKNISTINENLVLIYGENVGVQDEIRKEIKKKFKESEILLFNQDEILKNPNLIFTEITNISLFEKEKIILINQSNIFYAFMVILGPVCYTIGGLFSLKLKHIKNEVLTSSILIWAVILLLPIMFIFENPTELRPSLNATISLLYLGIVATAIAWLMRFYILKNNGLVFQSQVAYIIPIFGLIFGYIFLNEKITYKIIVALIAVLISTYLIERSKKTKITDKLS